MTVDDVLNEAVFGPLAPSPSGEWVAVVTQPNGCCYEPVFGGRLWLVSPATGARRPLGEKELPRHWLEHVAWSPDGRRLAIVARSLADGHPRLYVWSESTGVEQVSSGPIAFQLSLGSSPLAPAVWLDDTTIVYAQVPDSAIATVDRSPESFFMEVAPRMWETMKRGVHPSAHALESGVTGVARASVTVRLTIAHPGSGARRVLAAPAIPARYRRVFFHLSPRTGRAVVRAADKATPSGDTPLTIDFGWRELVGAFVLRPGSEPRWLTSGLRQGSTVRWMPDDSTVEIVGAKADRTERTRWRAVIGATGVTVDSASAGEELIRAGGERERPASIRLPAGARSVMDFPVPGVTLYVMRTDSGTFAHVTSWQTGRGTLLMVLNRYLAGIAHGRRMLIEYRGKDGEALKGVVLLPPGYRPGKRYPVFTWVYAGNTYRSANIDNTVLSNRPSSAMNLQLLAARGYVVLFPSIPLAPDTVRRDQYLSIVPPVIGAVDRLIELGIADPDRLAVGGHSNGGYTTNVIITQTNRFRAAITMAGMSNLTSVVGTFDVRFRYTDMAVRDGTFQMNWAEAGQANLGASLMENLWAYIRNSPLFYADRIRTPLLLIHGDQDFVHISEAEQLFTSLYRQGKRARFVRYWGEGHSIGASPANIRHMWNEILAWLDEHCDVRRDREGRMVFDDGRVSSRR
ncbi:MAG TPA: prolyl oligopeptidase family serine peptidase [Gemmatimonadaceae bacterium]|nr:prolyl oligopeptidase family serine peptidase [Gemmatimonadaceae bacterium]